MRSRTQAIQPVVIEPNAVFTVSSFNQAFGLKSSTLRREIREKRLRYCKRAGRYYFLGSWILEWLLAGEMQAKPKADRDSARLALDADV